jgi:hypothetical protein
MADLHADERPGDVAAHPGPLDAPRLGVRSGGEREEQTGRDADGPSPEADTASVSVGNGARHESSRCQDGEGEGGGAGRDRNLRVASTTSSSAHSIAWRSTLPVNARTLSA